MCAWTDEEREGFAQAIEEEAEHLNHLVGNLLDISRIEGGSLKPQMSWYDLGVAGRGRASTGCGR